MYREAGHSEEAPARFFGRAFETTDGRVILPCEYCGAPAWEPQSHTCPLSTAAMLIALEVS